MSYTDNGDVVLLKQEWIDTFHRDGVVVVPHVFTQEELYDVRETFHADLAQFGVIHDDLPSSACHLEKLSSTGGAGGILDLF